MLLPHSCWQLPPLQEKSHVAPAVQLWWQLPPAQSNVQCAPAPHSCWQLPPAHSCVHVEGPGQSWSQLPLEHSFGSTVPPELEGGVDGGVAVEELDELGVPDEPDEPDDPDDPDDPEDPEEPVSGPVEDTVQARANVPSSENKPIFVSVMRLLRAARRRDGGDVATRVPGAEPGKHAGSAIDRDAGVALGAPGGSGARRS